MDENQNNRLISANRPKIMNMLTNNIARQKYRQNARSANDAFKPTGKKNWQFCRYYISTNRRTSKRQRMCSHLSARRHEFRQILPLLWTGSKTSTNLPRAGKFLCELRIILWVVVAKPRCQRQRCWFSPICWLKQRRADHNRNKI